ncbi:hypothetical protein ACFQ3P_40825 [Paraburkholderia sabiae]|uniref:Uncharacterized protein n=1 Tax=Paraburkholderia sabiae TaxID=273251 RepID=A0ABU9QRE0_9BURK|nr:hypothetical protein [Paraburkholderia sabiae]WJZ77257.1 hypothetical protein QEN71_18100 [Paraburkholderia sabiae]
MSFIGCVPQIRPVKRALASSMMFSALDECALGSRKKRAAFGFIVAERRGEITRAFAHVLA